MGTNNKFELLQELVVRVNDLVDARGVDKCVAIITIVRKLNELEHLLHDEDATHNSAISELTEKLDKLTNEEKDGDTDADADA